MTERDGTRAMGWRPSGRLVRGAAWLAASLLVWTVEACGRFGYDLLPRDDDATGGAGPGAGAGGVGTGGDGTGGSGISGLSGGAGNDGSAGSDADGGGVAGDAAVGGAGAGGTASGAGGSASTPRCDDGVENGEELAIDCGGPVCEPCPCTFGTPELLGNPNYSGNLLWKPSLSEDGLTLYVAVVVPGVNEQIAVSTRPDRGNTFGLANPLPAAINQSVEGTPHISLDGRSLYFFSERAGSGQGARDLYVATRSDPNGNFDTVAPLASVNSSALDHLPWTSADELTLYFASQRNGTMDIWRATRASRNDAFGAPATVSELNSGADDNGMTLTQDERSVIFASNRPNGAGDYDLYQAVRARNDEPFSTPVLLTNLATSALETDPALSPDGQELFFVSQRNGDNTIWRSLRTCP